MSKMVCKKKTKKKAIPKNAWDRIEYLIRWCILYANNVALEVEMNAHL